jgi:O-antigen/teichoic acid export membrane protein
MNLRGRLASEFLSIGTSQVVAALGQLAGVRVLTEILSPGLFGQVSLMIGMVALATSALLNPTLQAVLRFFPVQAEAGDPGAVRRAAVRRIQRIVALAAPVGLLACAAAVAAGWCSVLSALLLVLLTAVEGLKLYRTALMNAARQHHRYGMWMVGEAWGRPLVAYAAVRAWQPSIEIVLAAFIVPSLTLYLLMGRTPGTASTPAGAGDDALVESIRRYSNPLIPLGVLGWVSGMGDRYLIGALLSARDVGMYAAAYGLASRPLLMLSTVAETSIRPAYYAALARHDAAASRKYLLVWLGVVLAAGLAACGFIALFQWQLARLLLGPEFRESAPLMPWVGAGYMMLALYAISARICLAHNATRAVTITETAGAVVAVATGVVFIRAYGLLGAAAAVPVYYGVQAAIAAVFAARAVSRQAA